MKLLRILYQPYKILVWAPLGLVITVSSYFFALALCATVGPRRGAIAGVIWGRLMSWITPVPVKVEGRHYVEKKQSYVIVANHQSAFDIFVLYGWMGVDFRWIMKQELRKVPIIGYSCFKLGHIFIDRSNRSSAIASIEAAKPRIREGTSVLFFPEGTRRSGGLGEFKKGAFRTALSMEIPVLPVSVVNTDRILPNKTLALFPGRASLVIHEPIDVAGYDSRSVDELVARTRSAIASALTTA
jgi:1-acyl-sn-glycerol-3-phosphate acyltransferase